MTARVPHVLPIKLTLVELAYLVMEIVLVVQEPSLTALVALLQKDFIMVIASTIVQTLTGTTTLIVRFANHHVPHVLRLIKLIVIPALPTMFLTIMLAPVDVQVANS
jgi:hypothetical protein